MGGFINHLEFAQRPVDTFPYRLQICFDGLGVQYVKEAVPALGNIQLLGRLCKISK